MFEMGDISILLSALAVEPYFTSVYIRKYCLIYDYSFITNQIVKKQILMYFFWKDLQFSYQKNGSI